jgi:hypothetical protein
MPPAVSPVRSGAGRIGVICESGYALVSSRKVQQVEKPKILITTRSLRSLEITEITEKKQWNYKMFSVPSVPSVSSVVKAFDLDGSSTGKGTTITTAMPVAGRNA